jgi:hypothetical protein
MTASTLPDQWRQDAVVVPLVVLTRDEAAERGPWDVGSNGRYVIVNGKHAAIGQAPPC